MLLIGGQGSIWLARFVHGNYPNISRMFSAQMTQHHQPKPTRSLPRQRAQWDSKLTMTIPVPPGWYRDGCLLHLLWDRLQCEFSYQPFVLSRSLWAGETKSQHVLSSAAANKSIWCALMNWRSACNLSLPLTLAVWESPSIFWKHRQKVLGDFLNDPMLPWNCSKMPLHLE